jgi:hypothetical protein
VVVALVIAGAVAAILYLAENDTAAIVAGVVGFLATVAWEGSKAYRKRGATVRDALAERPPRATDADLAEALHLGSEDPSNGSHPVDDGELGRNRASIDDLCNSIVETLQGRATEHYLLVKGEEGPELELAAYQALCAAGQALAKQGKTIKVLVPRVPPSSAKLADFLVLDPFPFYGPAVLWLDHINGYLPPGGSLTPAALQEVARLDPPAVVLATIDWRSYDAITDGGGQAVISAFAPGTVFIRRQ